MVSNKRENRNTIRSNTKLPSHLPEKAQAADPFGMECSKVCLKACSVVQRHEPPYLSLSSTPSRALPPSLVRGENDLRHAMLTALKLQL